MPQAATPLNAVLTLFLCSSVPLVGVPSLAHVLVLPLENLSTADSLDPISCCLSI